VGVPALATVLAGAPLALGLAGCGSSEPSAGEVGPLNSRLIEAARAGRTEEARELLDRGADPGAAAAGGAIALVAAAYGNHVGTARLLELVLAGGADVRARDSYDGTGLIRAAERGHAGIVRRLETDIDLDHVNRLGWTGPSRRCRTGL
jgi:ankyrin repeat protein